MKADCLAGIGFIPSPKWLEAITLVGHSLSTTGHGTFVSESRFKSNLGEGDITLQGEYPCG